MTSTPFAIKNGSNYHLYSSDEIEQIQAFGNYSNIFTKTGEKIISIRNLRHIENLLPKYFYRSHRSHIVNLKQVNRIEENSGLKIVLKSGNAVPISSSKKRELIQKMNAIYLGD